jgi:hypoxanthine phosphoribosyltransferase
MRSAVPAEALNSRIGEVYLGREEIRSRVAELGAEIAADYDDLEPLFVAPLKASLVFLADLSRATPILHHLDFVELAPYDGNARRPQPPGVRLLKDLDARIDGRDVLVVEDIIDTGLTLNFLRKTLLLRNPRSLAAATLLDRPYRRLVEDLPVRYVGFTVPDEYFVGYGFDLDERHRNLPDIHYARPD